MNKEKRQIKENRFVKRGGKTDLEWVKPKTAKERNKKKGTTKQIHNRRLKVQIGKAFAFLITRLSLSNRFTINT